MNSKLPEGWISLPLEDINQREAQSIDPSKYPEEIFELYSVPSFDTLAPEIATGAEIKSGKQRVNFGDVLICKINPRINRVWTVGVKNTYEQIGSTEWIIISPIEVVASKYLVYFCRSNNFRALLNSETSGVGGSLTRARPKLVLKYEVSVPPLAEQHRIVAKLDEAMQRVEASQERLEKIPGLLKQFRQAVLAAAVSGRLTDAWRVEHPQQETGADLLARIRAERRAQWEERQLAKMKGKQLTLNDSWKQKYEEPAEPDTSELPELPEGWVWTGFPHVAALEPYALKAGPFGSALKKDFYTSTGYKIYGQEQVIKQDPYYGDYFIDEQRFKLLSSCRVKPGDILISLVGTIGKALVLPSDILPGIINPRLVKLSLDKKTIVPEYAKIYVDSPSVRDYLQLVSHGGTMDVLNLSILKELPLSLPSFAEQLEIVRQVNHYFALADALEDRFGQAAALVEQLPQVLLAKAFSGQLVPQDPNDEPASVLLERLRNTPALTQAKRVPKSPKSNLQLEFAVPQSLLEILTQHPDGISPEKLFSLAGFTDADVDSFYQELARLQPQLEETKPTGEAAKMWPSMSTTLRIKAQADAN